MNGADKARFLTRLARRYALRHRGQTARAVLGLVVVTVVLTVGLGMGESIAGSITKSAFKVLGPVDVTLRSESVFDEDVARRLLHAPGVRAHDVTGAPSLRMTGSVAHPAKELAEAFAFVRGVAPDEPRALGPLRAPDGRELPEPRRGEVVLSESLAERLEAGPGDRVVLRVPTPGSFPDAPFERFNLTGVSGAPSPLGGHAVEVREGALGMGVGVVWTDALGPVRIEARAPSGVTFANASATSPVVLVVEPPLEAGTWTLSVRALRPVPYSGSGAVVYPPPSLLEGAAAIQATVGGVAADGGRAGLTFRPVALLPLQDLQQATGARGLANLAVYRVGGDARAVVAAMEEALPEGTSAEVRPVKLEALEEAAEAGRETTGFLIVMGGFTLLAAVLLAYALFSALVEERRVELGISRALGLTRGEVAFAMTVEGALYAGVAALAGLVVGVGLLWGAIALIARVSAANDGPLFEVHLSPATALTALVVGTLVPLVTIGLASLRFARLDPSRAIRGIPDDPKGRRRAGLVAAAALVVAGALLSLAPIPRLVGLPIALAGVSLGLAFAGRRWLALVPAAAAIGVIAWSLYTFDAFPDETEELDPITTLARGAVLALGLSALAVASPKPYDAIGRLVSRRRSAPRAGFVALRYLVARRVPAGLTMAMISLVVVIVTVMGTLFLVFAGQIPEHEAGYAVVGESPLPLDGLPGPLPPDVARQVERVDVLHRHFEFRDPSFEVDGESIETPWWGDAFFGVTAEFAEGAEYEVVERAPAYADDAAMWVAVVRGEAMVVPASSEMPVPVGSRVRVETAIGRPTEYVVAGSVRMNYVYGAMVASEHVQAMGFPMGTFLFVRVAEGGDATAVAHRLTAEFAEAGVTFVSVPEEVAALTANLQAAILVFESFLALGIFVGLAATGFLASRAVHERIRDIGTLRALGFEESDVRRAFIIESVAVAAGGLVIGLACGLLVAHSVWWREVRLEGFPFRPPTLVLVAFATCVLGLAALAARNPAKRAAALPPAIAVRHVE